MTTPELPTSVSGIANLLTRASDAYYNGGTLLLDDASFDFLVERLREMEPTHPFLTTVGAPPPSENATELPYPMPSLDKIKPGQNVLARFIAKHPSVVLSEKLDGLSALWCPASKALYLRGDGRIGQPISGIVPHIQGLVPSADSWAIRGEIILPRAPGARALLNGLVHQTAPAKEALARVRFIAYEVIVPIGLARQAQFEWLVARGFETPWWAATTTLTEELCSQTFQERRGKSAYETDGIVVGVNQVPVKDQANKNPKDCVAFKMAVSDQSATTTVREVIWTASAQGYLIPRLRFDPVQIGGASIEFCAGHNARTVVDRGLGPGAQVKIRRSGDVIPTLDSVLFPATPSLPSDTSTWVWAEGPESTHICSKKLTAEQTVSQIIHFAKTHSIPGLGPANCRLLVKGGITGPATLWKMTAPTLGALLGPNTGETTFKALRAQLAVPPLTEMSLMVSSTVLPRGVGETKLKSLFTMYPDPRAWQRPALQAPTGWTDASFREFQTEYPKYEQWRAQEIFWIPYPILGAVAVAATTSTGPKRTVCFTGFRDKDLEQRVQEGPFEVVSGVSQTLGILVVPDGNTTQSEKVKKALKYGTVEVIERSEFVKKYISND